MFFRQRREAWHESARTWRRAMAAALRSVKVPVQQARASASFSHPCPSSAFFCVPAVPRFCKKDGETFFSAHGMRSALVLAARGGDRARSAFYYRRRRRRQKVEFEVMANGGLRQVMLSPFAATSAFLRR